MMIKNTYFYVVSVYDYDAHNEVYYYHMEKYSHHEFSIILQDCIDEVIGEYSKKEEYNDEEHPCDLRVSDVVNSTLFYRSMLLRGFKPVGITTRCALEEKRVFNDKFGSNVLRERYSDLSLGVCKYCFREDDDFYERCPISNERRK